jgi:hypothetical protein
VSQPLPQFDAFMSGDRRVSADVLNELVDRVRRTFYPEIGSLLDTALDYAPPVFVAQLVDVGTGPDARKYGWVEQRPADTASGWYPRENGRAGTVQNDWARPLNRFAAATVGNYVVMFPGWYAQQTTTTGTTAGPSTTTTTTTTTTPAPCYPPTTPDPNASVVETDLATGWVFIGGECSGVVVRVTGSINSDGYYPGVITFRRPPTTTTTQCPTTTTTTTATTTTTGTGTVTTVPPCPGNCVWSWVDPGPWLLNSSACTPGCTCDPPGMPGSGSQKSTTACYAATTTTGTGTTTTACPTTTTTTTTVDPSWEDGEAVLIQEVNADSLGFGCRFDGLACYGLVTTTTTTSTTGTGTTTTTTSTTTTTGTGTTSTTTTTTTPAPTITVVYVQSNDKSADCAEPPGDSVPVGCYGSCRFSWDNVNKVWTPTSNACCNDCLCDQPDYCPPTGVSCAVAITGCVDFNPAQTPPCNCVTTTTTTGTTGTTTTTTSDPHCAGCDWCGDAFGGWGICGPVTNFGMHCFGATCSPSCSYPAFPSASPCDRTHTPCDGTTTFTTGPPPVCGGVCKFVSDGTQWLPYAGFGCGGPCAGDPFGVTCNCPAPSEPPGPCNTVTITSCRCTGVAGGTTTTTTGGTTTTGTGTTTTGAPPLCTTTTANPSCNGYCLYTWSAGGMAWTYQNRTCAANCSCYAPTTNGTVDCEVRRTTCQTGPTTTTSTTTSTTTTTANPNCKCYGNITDKQITGGVCFYQGANLPCCLYTVTNVAGCCQAGTYSKGKCNNCVGNCSPVYQFVAACAQYQVGQGYYGPACGQ